MNGRYATLISVLWFVAPAAQPLHRQEAASSWWQSGRERTRAAPTIPDLPTPDPGDGSASNRVSHGAHYPRGLVEVLELLGMRVRGPLPGNVLSAVSSNGEEGTWRSASFPAPSGGPGLSLSANSSSVRGGSSLVTVVSRTPMTRLFVGDDTRSSDGYYELPVFGTEVNLQLDFSQRLPEERLELRYAAADLSGAVGPPARRGFDVVAVGTGNLQVTVSWDTRADVDLHVVEPSGEEIFYDNSRSDMGGMLDLDANRRCRGDDTRNENRVWDAPPRGRYVVRVNHWSSCGAGSTNYIVRVNGAGRGQVFRGTFTGGGERGGLGAGVEVAALDVGSESGNLGSDQTLLRPRVSAGSDACRSLAATCSQRQGRLWCALPQQSEVNCGPVETLSRGVSDDVMRAVSLVLEQAGISDVGLTLNIATSTVEVTKAVTEGDWEATRDRIVEALLGMSFSRLLGSGSVATAFSEPVVVDGELMIRMRLPFVFVQGQPDTL